MRTRAQVVLHHDSGVPEQAVSNTFYFDTDLDEAGTITQVRANIGNFYDSVNAPLLNSLGSYLSSEMSGVGTVKMYDLDDATPRVPFDTHDFTFSPGVSEPLPGQVALVLSFQAAKVSGLNQARRRGRIYLGPLDITATETSGGVARPTGGLVDTAIAALTRLKDDSGTNESNWSVYSETDDLLVPVLDGWVDNRFDTQRRRKAGITARNAWS